MAALYHLICIESESGISDEGEENTRKPGSTTDVQARKPASGELALALIGAAGGAHAKANLSSLEAGGQTGSVRFAAAPDGIGGGPPAGSAPRGRGEPGEGYRRSRWHQI